MTNPFSTPSRRDFLKAGSIAAVGLGAAPLVHASGKATIKVGLVGCGGRGRGAAENICQAAGTSHDIKLHALADAFDDNLQSCNQFLKENEKVGNKYDVAPDRCFVGFDAYQKVIDCCDLIILATPPGFRPGHIEAVINAGKHLFTEKPVAVDGTGIRKVLAAYEKAKSKNLAVVAGTQRRHEAAYLTSLDRIHQGEIGDVKAGRVYWNQGNIWARKRKEGMTDTEYQMRNWYHFLWLCGGHIVEQHVHNLDVACWVLNGTPVRCVGMGGRQVNTAPEFGESYDHFAVEYEFPNGVYVSSMCRQIDGCENNVSEAFVGTKGAWSSQGHRFTGTSGAGRGRKGVDPYVQEHIDLLDSIANGKPLNELQQVANSTLVAIMGRMSAFTGKAVTWDQALHSKLDTFPKTLDMKAARPALEIPTPGKTELV